MHLAKAHEFWSSHVKPGDHIIDATCGNGHDALFLANLSPGSLHLFDIQPEALAATHHRLFHLKDLNAHYYLASHENFPELPPISLIVYNLGYLPTANKAITTCTSSTLRSIKSALTLLKPGGMITITCYPGHLEGEDESNALKKFIPTLSNCESYTYFFTNNLKNPFLIKIIKIN
ncbi:MAG: methyltransferase domain-containing protein [Simkaniaceae bacterium]|nr:methyltransferase domain-containing protein [Simkaniaceae bacterium]